MGAASLFGTLRGRLLLTYAALILLLIVGLGGALLIAVEQLYVDRLAGQLAIQARLTARAMAPDLKLNPTPLSLDARVDELGAGIDPGLMLILADGTVVGDSRGNIADRPNFLAADEVAAAISAGAEGRDEVFEGTAGGELTVAAPVPGGDGVVVRVALPLSEVDSAVGRLQRYILLAASGSAVFAAIVAIGVAGRITAPLTALRRQANAVAQGQFDVTVQPSGMREFGDVARAFNAMTDRVQRFTRESERSRSRLEAIFSHLSDGVLIIDQTELVLGINLAAARMLERERTGAVGRPMSVVVRDADLIRLAREALGGNAVALSTISYAQGGRILEAAAEAIVDDRERLVIIVMRDVTELRRLEQVRREFVANVSHELRTPLASIRAVVETLEAGAIDDPTVSGDFLGRIVGEVDRLAGLVNELLDLARLESGRISLALLPVEVHSIANASVDRLREQIDRAGLTLSVEVPTDLPRVLADRVRIEQVLLNLVQNAIKYTPAGGSIRIGADLGDGVVQVWVADTGVGIAEDDLPRVFERFYKSDKARRSEGSGLGLAISKHIIQAHGGTIWAESTPGSGSTFHFTLPVEQG